MHNSKLLKYVQIPVILVVLAWTPFLNAATEGPSTEGTVNTLLIAIATGNYDAMVANATPALKSRITREAFTQVSTQLSARLKKGYSLQYLGSLRQQGVETFLWKVIYKDGGDEMLARLVIQDGKVAGFWLQ
jgi:hypothetical protein